MTSAASPVLPQAQAGRPPPARSLCCVPTACQALSWELRPQDQMWALPPGTPSWVWTGEAVMALWPINFCPHQPCPGEGLGKMGHLGPRASGGGGVVWGSPVRVLARGSCPSQSPASRRLSQGPTVCLSTSHLVTLQCAGGLWPFPRTPRPNLCVAAGKYFLQKQDGCEKNNNAPKPHLMGRSWARGLVRPE